MTSEEFVNQQCVRIARRLAPDNTEIEAANKDINTAYGVWGR